MKVKKKICSAGYMLGYWKGERVALMPKYHPHSKLDDYIVEEIEVEEGFEVPRLIDPLETPLAEIKEICEENNIEFFWVTGLSTHVRDVDLQKTDSLDKAINQFIALNSAGTTTTQYRRLFDRLVKEGILNPNSSVEEFEEHSSEVVDLAYNLPAEGSIEAKTRMFHILQSFQLFLEQPNTKKLKEHSGRYKHKREDFLTDDEAATFFPTLKKINSTFELIGKLMRYLNREMYLTQEEAPIISLESILHLKTDDLDQTVGHNVVNFYSQKTSGLKMFSFHIPDELYEQVLMLARNSDLYVFHNKWGAPFNPRQIYKAFFQASKAAKLGRIITPIHIR